jgi:plasmid stabilization system protein ParE
VIEDLRFGPEAAAELEDAALWYESRREGLGLQFLDAVEDALRLISEWPHSGTSVPGVRSDLPVRRVRVRRFPYHIVYLEAGAEMRILAVAHDRRSPGTWRNRSVN